MKLQTITDSMIRTKPFLKWAGGKGQLIETIRDSLPGDFADKKDLCYIEPFVGSGAVLFWILDKYSNVKKAIINDVNTDLMNAYRVVKQKPEDLILLLRRLQDEHDMLKSNNDRKIFYLEKRDEFNLRA